MQTMSLEPKRVDFNQVWQNIRSTAEKVITLQPVQRTVWNERFGDIYQLCVSYPEPEADRLYEEIKVFIDAYVKGLLETMISKSTNDLLQNYYDNWQTYSKGVDHLNYLFAHLNAQHLCKNKTEHFNIYNLDDDDVDDKFEIIEVAMEIWRNQVIRILKTSLISAIVNSYQKNRTHTFNTAVLCGVIDSFLIVDARGVKYLYTIDHGYKTICSIGLYRKMVEMPILEASGEYYKREAAQWLQSSNIPQYMKRVITLFQEEVVRCKKFLHKDSLAEIKRCCIKHFVVEYLTLLSGEIKTIVSEENVEDMRNMYLLLDTVRKIGYVMEYFAKEFMEHVKKVGLNRVSALKPENLHLSFVDTILFLYQKYRNMITTLFMNDQAFVSALDTACSHITNHRPANRAITTPELLAKYCDHYLKMLSKSMPESVVEERLNDSIVVFKYIQDEDMFQKFYSRMLAKRLIHQQSQSMDAEEGMINRLKKTRGYEFINKLHRMFTDIKVSEDLDKKFNDEYIPTEHVSLGLRFSVYILRAGSWPLGQSSLDQFAIPEKLGFAIRMFEQFYYKKFNSRKLTWLHNLCQGDLKLNYSDKPYIVTMQTYQMAVLLLFENIDSLTCSDIQETLQLDHEQFMKTINILVHSKLITANEEPVSNNTVLSLNTSYYNKRMKLKIINIMQKDSQQGKIQTVYSIEEDRKLYLQATILWIMKSRKVMKHSVLVEEIINQCSTSFMPSISVMKKCIEALIEKQYIQRTPNVTDEYRYIT